MKLKLTINLLLILIGVFLCVFTAFAEEKSLIIWLMPNEPPIAYQPSDKKIKEFLSQNPNLINTLPELKSDPDFSKAVLGQTEVLRLINSNYSGIQNSGVRIQNEDGDHKGRSYKFLTNSC
ncbi:hypothetical protein KKG56_08560, partial [bacterium]|nr:hypothetical protein [bacterium]